MVMQLGNYPAAKDLIRRQAQLEVALAQEAPDRPPAIRIEAEGVGPRESYCPRREEQEDRYPTTLQEPQRALARQEVRSREQPARA